MMMMMMIIIIIIIKKRWRSEILSANFQETGHILCKNPSMHCTQNRGFKFQSVITVVIVIVIIFIFSFFLLLWY